MSGVGQAISRYGLALVLAWIGFGKYVKMETRVLIEHSPLMSWVYDVFSATTVAEVRNPWRSRLRSSSPLRPVSARLSAIGSALAIVLFCGTLSFLLTTPRGDQSIRRTLFRCSRPCPASSYSKMLCCLVLRCGLLGRPCRRQLFTPTVNRSEIGRVHSGRRTRCWSLTANPASSNRVPHLRR